MRAPCGVWVVLVAACGFNPAGSDDDGTAADAAADADQGDGGGEADAPDLDAATTDGAVIDGVVTDAAMIDAATIDARRPDAGVDARPPCPASYDVVFGGSRYRFGQIALVWTTASAACSDDLPGRTHLATFENAADMDGAIAAVNPGNNAEPHVGARCVASDCAATNEWSWVTGGAVTDSLWTAGEPDNGTTEKAGAAVRDMGTWKLQNVTANLTTLPYICECDP